MLKQTAIAIAALALTGAGAFAADQGDAKRGAKIYKKCQSCHMVGPKAKNRVGPHLNELFGRKAAGLDDFKYSKDMKRAGADGLVWSADKLHVFLENPKALVTGTRMAMRGIKHKQDRDDLLAFLRAYSANPQDIPESAPTATPKDPDVDPAILAIVGDPEYGEYLASECTTCHQADGKDKGMPSITGWPTNDFVVVMHAYKVKARTHPVMQMMAGRLSNEEIAALAAYFKGVKQ